MSTTTRVYFQVQMNRDDAWVPYGARRHETPESAFTQLRKMEIHRASNNYPFLALRVSRVVELTFDNGPQR